MESTFDLNSVQLARLLTIAARPGRSAADRPAGELLREWLARPVSLDAAEPDSLPAVLGRPCDELAGHAGRPVGALLLGPETGAPARGALKDYAKCLVRRAWSESERAAATALYYGAIAGALVFDDQKMTQHSYPKLDEGLAKLVGRHWIPPDLNDLLQKARAACHEAG